MTTTKRKGKRAGVFLNVEARTLKTEKGRYELFKSFIDKGIWLNLHGIEGTVVVFQEVNIGNCINRKIRNKVSIETEMLNYFAVILENLRDCVKEDSIPILSSDLMALQEGDTFLSNSFWNPVVSYIEDEFHNRRYRFLVETQYSLKAIIKDIFPGRKKKNV